MTATTLPRTTGTPTDESPSDRLTPEQRRQIRSMRLRRCNEGWLAGDWPDQAEMVEVLLEHALDAEPFGPKDIIARHPDGRVYLLHRDGRQYQRQIAFDPVYGNHVVTSTDNDSFEPRMARYKVVEDEDDECVLFGPDPDSLELEEDRSGPASPEVWWTGQLFDDTDELVGIDLEGTLITDGQYPQIALSSVSTKDGRGFLLMPEDIVPYLEQQIGRNPKTIFCGWNIAEFDWPACDYRLPECVERTHDSLYKLAMTGRFIDGMLLARLYDLARYGMFFGTTDEESGKSVALPQWVVARKPYSLASQAKRWLGIDLPKDEGLTFGTILGAQRQLLTQKQADYAIADSMVCCGIVQMILDDPFTQRLIKKTRHFMDTDPKQPGQGMLGIRIASLERAKPFTHPHAVAPPNWTEYADEEYEPHTRANGMRYGIQTLTVQMLGAYALSWADRTGVGIDVAHAVRYLLDLEYQEKGRLGLLYGDATELIYDVRLDKKSGKTKRQLVTAVPADMAPDEREIVLGGLRKWKDIQGEAEIVEVPKQLHYRPFYGIIGAARHFPSPRQLEIAKERYGDDPLSVTFIVTRAVTDDYDPTALPEGFSRSPVEPLTTGTKQSFARGSVIRWNEPHWRWDVLAGDEAHEAADAIKARVLQDSIDEIGPNAVKAGAYVKTVFGEEVEYRPLREFAPPTDEGEDDDSDDEEDSKTFADYVPSTHYQFAGAQSKIDQTAMYAYLREYVYPPAERSESLHPKDDLPPQSDAALDVQRMTKRKRDEWLLFYSTREVTDIPDPIVMAYFWSGMLGKDQSAVKSYLPGFLTNRHGKLPIAELVKALDLQDVKFGRRNPKTFALAARTGRTSQKRPNLQQASKKARNRACVRARRGTRFGSFDVGTTELGTLSETMLRKYGNLPQMVGKDTMALAINKGWDLHLKMGLEMSFRDIRNLWLPILMVPKIAEIKRATNPVQKGRLLGQLAQEIPEYASFLQPQTIAAEGKKVGIDLTMPGEDIAKDIWVHLCASAIAHALGRDVDDIKKEIGKNRQSAKPIDFGVPGGMKANRLRTYAMLAYGVMDMTVEQAEEYRTLMLTLYPDLDMYLKEGAEHILRGMPLPAPPNGYYSNCFTVTGRLAGCIASTTTDDEEGYDSGFNNWHNYPFQGLAADGAKLGAYYTVIDGILFLLFVHDELDTELAIRRSAEQRVLVENDLRNGMRDVIPSIDITTGGKETDVWSK